MKSLRLCLQALAVTVIAALVLSDFSPVYAAGQPQCSRTAPSQFVCLTVDDGCSLPAIQSMLTTFKKYNVKCTFFVVGVYLTRPGYQAVWQQAIRDGHEICYHTMKHQHVAGMSRSQIIADISAWEKAAHVALGDGYQIPKFARLPGGGGSFDTRILQIYAEQGYHIIHWSVDTLTGPPSHSMSIPRYVRSYTRPGSIILTHFGGSDAYALPRYLKWLNEKYRLVKISDAFSQPAKPVVGSLADDADKPHVGSATGSFGRFAIR